MYSQIDSVSRKGFALRSVSRLMLVNNFQRTIPRGELGNFRELKCLNLLD